jgi:hypothetical protein
MDGEASGLVMLAFLLLGVVSLAWHYQRGRTIVEQWAAREGYQLERCDYRYLARGPFLWSSSKSQAVYRIVVRSRDGPARHGWIRCGGWLAGVFSDRVDVRWDAPDDH